MENIRYPGEAQQEIMLFCDLDGELIQDPINTHGGIAVYAYSEDPERSVMVYECIRQDQDMYQLFGSDRPGIEGIHWEIDDEGYLKRPDSWDIDANAFSTNFWGGRVDRFESPRRDEWPGIYDMWARLDTFVVPNPYAQFAFDKAPVDAQLSNISSLIVEHERPICLGKAGDPVAAVEAYRAALKAAGIDEYMAEVQRQLDEYKVYKESM